MSTDWHTPAVTTNLAEVRRADEELDQAITDNMGGGGGGGGLASPDDPIDIGDPILYPPDALNDEFDDASLNVSTKWTVINPLSDLSWYEGRYGVVLRRSNVDDTPGGMASIYQAIPSGDFTVWLKFSLLAAKSGYVCGGLMLRPSGASGDACKVFGMDNFGHAPAGFTISSAGAISNLFSSFNAGVGDTAYLRIRRNASDYFFSSSVAGLGWISRNDDTAITHSTLGSPDQFGIALVYDTNFAPGVSPYNFAGIARFFRYVPVDVGHDHVLNDVA